MLWYIWIWINMSQQTVPVLVRIMYNDLCFSISHTRNFEQRGKLLLVTVTSSLTNREFFEIVVLCVYSAFMSKKKQGAHDHNVITRIIWVLGFRDKSIHSYITNSGRLMQDFSRATSEIHSLSKKKKKHLKYTRRCENWKKSWGYKMTCTAQIVRISFIMHDKNAWQEHPSKKERNYCLQGGSC